MALRRMTRNGALHILLYTRALARRTATSSTAIALDGNLLSHTLLIGKLLEGNIGVRKIRLDAYIDCILQGVQMIDGDEFVEYSVLGADLIGVYIQVESNHLTKCSTIVRR